MSDARPLYFFDDDGARSAILWFLKLVVNDGVDPLSASREVNELGPKTPEYWLAAHVYLNARQADSNRSRAIEPPAPIEPPLPAVEPATSVPGLGPDDVFAPEALVPEDGPLAATASGIDETRWRPLAAMLLTGLSLPLAYVSRSALSGRTLRRLASLPAPARRLLSLPAKSDA